MAIKYWNMTEYSDVDADPEAGRSYEVVVNHEEQYSLWPVDNPPPAGWRTIGMRGSKTECLEHIEQAWTDMRPRSLRERSSTHG
jgi:MbtH protein